MATFRRTKDDEWVVQGTVDEVRPGKVSVERKDGSTRVVDVESVGRPFNRNGVQMVYGYLAKKPPVVDECSPVSEPSGPAPAPQAELVYDVPEDSPF